MLFMAESPSGTRMLERNDYFMSTKLSCFGVLVFPNLKWWIRRLRAGVAEWSELCQASLWQVLMEGLAGSGHRQVA